MSGNNNFDNNDNNKYYYSYDVVCIQACEAWFPPRQSTWEHSQAKSLEISSTSRTIINKIKLRKILKMLSLYLFRLYN